MLLVNTSFSIFSESLRFFKVEATFPYSGNAFFNKSFIRLVETVSLDQRFFLLVEATSSSLETVSREELVIASGQLIFWLMEINFFSIFQRLLPVIVFFPSSGNDVSRKSFIPANGNGF